MVGVRLRRRFGLRRFSIVSICQHHRIAEDRGAGWSSDSDDEDGEHPNERMQRLKFQHGGRNVYKEEDWVVSPRANA